LFLFKFVRIHPCLIVLCESFACVHHPSLTVKLLHRFVDILAVHWAPLLKIYPDAVFTGRVHPDANFPQKIRQKEEKKGHVLVTVGSTQFQNLIEEIDDKNVLDTLKKMGYSGLHVQYGSGRPPSLILQHQDDPDFEITAFDYKPSLREEMEKADMVIGHAGAGTILEVLGMEKNLIVVPNDTLMRGHQSDIAEELQKYGFLHVIKCSKLRECIGEIDFSQSLLFPKNENEALKEKMMEFVR